MNEKQYRLTPQDCAIIAANPSRIAMVVHASKENHYTHNLRTALASADKKLIPAIYGGVK